ncbi:MAG: PspC domain-containing protein, partial [Patescibacteria group bacterium]
MKKAISITLAGLVFNIEEDAYQKLDWYLNSIRRHYQNNNEEKEILSDIESSLAEKFSSKLKTSRQAITLGEVEEAVKVMGTIEEIEVEPSLSNHQSDIPVESTAARKLYRNPDDAIIAGVCSGLAAYFGLDPVYIRLLFILLVFVNGLGLLAYAALWIVMPPAKTSAQKLTMQGEPVNLKKIEEVVKEKSKLVKEEGQAMLKGLSQHRGGFYRLLSFPVRLMEAAFGFLKKIFKVLGPVLSVILGIIFTVASLVTVLGLTVASGLALFNINSPYLVSDLPLNLLAVSPFYYAAILSLYFVALVPIVFLLLLGWTFIRRRN